MEGLKLSDSRINKKSWIQSLASKDYLAADAWESPWKNAGPSSEQKKTNGLIPHMSILGVYNQYNNFFISI